MNGTRLVASLFAAGALLTVLGGAPLLSAPQSSPPPQEKKEKKKARKVWTNEDLQQLQGSRGVNVVGTSLKKPEEAQPAAGQAPAQLAEKNFYSDLTLEERQVWIDKLEEEIAQAETSLTDLRGRLLSATTDEERASLAEQVAALENAVGVNRAEIELIRTTPLPKPAKPGQQPKTQPAAPAPPPS